MLHLDRIRILLSLSFTLSLGPRLSRSVFERGAFYPSVEKTFTCVYIRFPRDDIGELRDNDRGKGKGKKENSIVEQRRSRLIGRAAPKKRYRGEDLSLHHRKPRSLGGKKNNLSLRGDPRGVRCSSVHGPVCLSLLPGPALETFVRDISPLLSSSPPPCIPAFPTFPA